MRSRRSLKIHRFDPHEPTNIYVAHLLPFGSVEGNVRKRLQRTAEISGYTILAAHAPGTGKPYVSGGKSLRRGDIRAVASQFYEPFADAIQTQAGPNARRIIAAADSGRVALTAALALHEVDLVKRGKIERPIIQAVLGRDGALLEPMRVREAAAHLLRNGGKRLAWEAPMPAPARRTQIYAAACSVAEMISHARLMSGSTPRELIEELAGADVPFRYVSLTDGLAASVEGVRAFNAELERLRDEADVPAQFVPELRRGAHGDLPQPETMAEDLIATAILVS